MALAFIQQAASVRDFSEIYTRTKAFKVALYYVYLWWA